MSVSSETARRISLFEFSSMYEKGELSNIQWRLKQDEPRVEAIRTYDGSKEVVYVELKPLFEVFDRQASNPNGFLRQMWEAFMK